MEMNRKAQAVLISAFAALAFSPALFAQGPLGPPPFGGFPGGRGGFRVLGVEGCLQNGGHAPAGTPGYAAQVSHTRTEPVLNGNPVTVTNTYEAYRDNNGVSYQRMTLPPMGASKTSRTVICITDPNQQIRLVVDP